MRRDFSSATAVPADGCRAETQAAAQAEAVDDAMLEKYVCVVPKSIAIPFIASTPRLMQKLHGKKVNKNFLKEARR